MKKSRTVAGPTAVESPRHLPLVDLLCPRLKVYREFIIGPVSDRIVPDAARLNRQAFASRGN
jgi:hypothetical protein